MPHVKKNKKQKNNNPCSLRNLPHPSLGTRLFTKRFQRIGRDEINHKVTPDSILSPWTVLPGRSPVGAALVSLAPALYQLGVVEVGLEGGGRAGEGWRKKRGGRSEERWPFNSPSPTAAFTPSMLTVYPRRSHAEIMAQIAAGTGWRLSDLGLFECKQVRPSNYRAILTLGPCMAAAGVCVGGCVGERTQT